MKFAAPAQIHLRRAQLIFMLVTLVPTVLMTATGIVLLVLGSGSLALTIGVLTLAFCTTAITGYILGTIFVGRGASLARVQNDFMSSVTHELRTPLTSIKLFMESLGDERFTDPEQKRKILQLLGGEVERLELLLERLVELSRIETGRHPFAREPVPVSQIVEDAMRSFRAATLSAPADVEVDVEDGLVVTGDRSTLALSLLNLLTNAWKYTPEDKEIEIRAHAIGDKRAAIVVVDNGPGIPRGEQRHIFEKFERGKSAVDSRTDGVGLGLATVKAIVDAHRGKVEVRSRPGRGAEFRLILPRSSS